MKAYLGWNIDFANPRGAPAYVGPDSMHWRVFKNPIALGIGGVAAVLLEFADARVRSGVWDHSSFKSDPIGRSRRTGMAAMIGVYGPKDAARRVIQGVTNMHARVNGATPGGENYRALDIELLDWVAATASYGFLNAYDRFVSPLSEAEKQHFYSEAEPVARLYGVQRSPKSDADFMAMLNARAPRFEPHPIVREFLGIIESGPGALGLPIFVRRAMAHASVSLLPPLVRERLELGPEYDLSPLAARMVRMMGAAAERIAIPNAPPAQASRRLGLPGDFLYRSREGQARVLARWQAPEAVAAE